MDARGGAAGGPPAAWTKLALSLGAATALAVVAHRLTRRGRGGPRAGDAVVVTAKGDQEARSWAEPGAVIVAQHALGEIKGLRAISLLSSDVTRHLCLDAELLEAAIGALAPGASLTARLAEMPEAEAARLETLALLAGALDPKVCPVTSDTAGRLFELTCSRPSWDDGASAMLQGESAQGTEYIDEDALLGEVPKPMGKGKSDCSSQPKACANCSCGRKELEDKMGAEKAKEALEKGKVRSACGSCSLGDAFRCESCPYRGLPAFKPGTKVELSSGETAGTGQLGVFETADAASVDADRAGGGRLLVSA